MERYNKSTTPVNAEKNINDLSRDSNSRPQQHRLALHYPSPLPTAQLLAILLYEINDCESRPLTLLPKHL